MAPELAVTYPDPPARAMESDGNSKDAAREDRVA